MNKRSLLTTVAVLTILWLAAAAAAGGGHGGSRPVKKGILLVAFGTSVPQARAALDNIEAQVRAAFPETAIRWAYSSSMIRRKLAREGLMYDSPEMALARMMDENFTHVAVQSLHTIAGEEFHDLRRNAGAFQGMADGFERIVVGEPLLSRDADIVKVADAALATIPGGRKAGEAVVLMGHGSTHPSNAVYAALMFRLQQRDPDIFVGAVEGYPEIGDIRGMLLGKKIQKAWLMPLMSVAGDHARNDLAGDGDDSWKSVLTAAGIACETVLKGTAEYDDFVAIWVDHLRRALENL